HVLRIDRLLKPRQLSTQGARPPEAPLEQRLLKPAVEVLRATVEWRLSFGNEHRADALAPAQPDHPRQGPRRWPPAGQLAGVVELNLLGPAQVFPALPEKPQDLVHLAGPGQAQAQGPVEGVLATPDRVAAAAALPG